MHKSRRLQVEQAVLSRWKSMDWDWLDKAEYPFRQLSKIKRLDRQ